MHRTRLDSDAPLLGQPIGEVDETGAWTDYLFAVGERIARSGQFAATPVAVQQVTVRFTNDTCSACLGRPPFQDRNLQVDSITIGGFTIPSSDPSVSFAGGYYVPPGLMATNGDLTFTLASPLTGPVSVQAWGTPDTGVYPHMQVLVNGALVSEYDVTASPQAYTAALTPTDPSVTTTFYLADHLGSAQMEFSSNGTPLSSSQFFPFGGEINPVPTTNHYKFTGKERDTESGLDYFGARYYGSSMGRFMSPDWSAGPTPVPFARLTDPQSLNLYSYVGNNPLSRRDLDGHIWDWLKKLGNSLGEANCWCSGKKADEAITRNRAAAAAKNAAREAFNRRPEVQSFIVTMTLITDPLAAGGMAGDATAASEIEGSAGGAADSGSLIELNKSLASEEQMGQISAGQGQPILGAGTGKPLSAAETQRLSSLYGGAPGDWQKVASGNYNPGGAKGGGFETHAYQNTVTGQVVEMKSKPQ